MPFNIIINSLPNNGGSPITDIQYERNNSGTWTTVGGATIGTYSVPAIQDGDTIQLRAVNAVGNSAESDTKTATAASLTTPVYLGAAVSGNNNAVDSHLADYPAHDAGDLLVVVSYYDNRLGYVGNVNVTGISGETVYQEQALIGNFLSTNDEQSTAIHSFVANATRSAGTGILVDNDGSVDNLQVVVFRIQAGTFKATAPRLGSITHTYENAVQSATLTGAISNAQAQSLVFAVVNYAFNAPTWNSPSGWTERINNDNGAVVAQLVTRNAATTASENVSAVTLSSNTNSNWNALTGLILPNGA